jgi:predicted molibdopterin-dependent oxidoreductase YjgC
MLLDGMPVEAEEGEPIAAILLRTAPFICRRTPVSGELRAPYCMMGACFDCLVTINGQTSVRSCLAHARDGMEIMRQLDMPDPLGKDAA